MQAAEMEMANSKKLQEDIWTQSVAATRLPQVQDSGATFPVWQAKKNVGYQTVSHPLCMSSHTSV